MDSARLQKSNPLPCGGKKREGPAHAAGHIRAPREHQVFITGIPMKQLQGKKNHTLEGKNNKVTHANLGLPQVRPALGQGGPRHVWSSVQPSGAPGGGELSLQGSQAWLPANVVPTPTPTRTGCARLQTWSVSACTALPSPGKLD